MRHIPKLECFSILNGGGENSINTKWDTMCVWWGGQFYNYWFNDDCFFVSKNQWWLLGCLSNKIQWWRVPIKTYHIKLCKMSSWSLSLSLSLIGWRVYICSNALGSPCILVVWMKTQVPHTHTLSPFLWWKHTIILINVCEKYYLEWVSQWSIVTH